MENVNQRIIGKNGEVPSVKKNTQKEDAFEKKWGGNQKKKKQKKKKARGGKKCWRRVKRTRTGRIQVKRGFRGRGGKGGEKKKSGGNDRVEWVEQNGGKSHHGERPWQ